MRTGFPRPSFALALALVAVLSGVRPAASDGPAPKKLVVALSGIAGLDPAFLRTAAEERLALACCEGLTVIDPTTGQPAPGAASAWTTSPDGRTWTFTLRPAKWTRKFGDAFEEQGDVKASDFVGSWLRLLDPTLRSPHAMILDGIPEARVYATESRRGSALDRIAAALVALGGTGKRTLSGEEVFNFVNDEDREMRRWCGGLPDSAVQDLLKWPQNTPCQSVKYGKAIEALKAQAKKSVEAADDARAHLGVDRGFYAKDDKTLVVEVAGPSPWLPSLLARAPLVPARMKSVEKKRTGAFTDNFATNGAYVSTTSFPSRTRDNAEMPAFNCRLFRNPGWWRAASVATTDIVLLVGPNDIDADDAVLKYLAGDVHWILAAGLGSRRAQNVLAAKDPAWKCKVDPDKSGDKAKEQEKCERETGKYRALAADAYEVSGSGVAFLRFNCSPPLNKPDVRRALAATVGRAALVKAASGPTPPAATRFVPARVTGAVASVKVPSFDASKAKGWYGSKKLFEEQGFMLIACPSDETAVADLLAKQWKAALPDDASTWAGQDEDLRRRLDSGNWNAAIDVWSPRFDDPLALLSAFTSGNPVSGTNWSNPTYDALIKAAYDVQGFVAAPDPALKDVAAIQSLVAAAKPGDGASLEALRRGFLAEAETILLAEAVVVPLWTTVDSGVVAKNVRGLSFLGTTPRNILDLIPLVGVTAGP